MPKFNVKPVNMDFHYSDLANVKLPSAYERLLLDCMMGDATLYSRGDAVEAAWQFIQPILDAWENDPMIPVYGYPAGAGPRESDSLVEGGTTWRYPCKRTWLTMACIANYKLCSRVVKIATNQLIHFK